MNGGRGLGWGLVLDAGAMASWWLVGAGVGCIFLELTVEDPPSAISIDAPLHMSPLRRRIFFLPARSALRTPPSWSLMSVQCIPRDLGRGPVGWESVKRYLG